MVFMTAVKLLCADIWVSPYGDDRNSGLSRVHPLQTLHAALRQARELRRLNDPSAKTGINILLEEGIYCQPEPLLIRPEDSGTPSSPTLIKGIDGDHVVISGGVTVSGWKLAGRIEGLSADMQDKIWMVDVPLVNGNVIDFRQLWINRRKAVRTRNIADFRQMDRIISDDIQNEILWVPTSSVARIAKSPHAELVLHQMWEIAVLRIQSIGLDFKKTTHDTRVVGCLFRDIAGNGMQIGMFSEPSVETHLPYRPQDEREICTGQVIENNYIADIGNEDWGCVGICAGYVRDILIRYNELCDLPYTGISVGWGWTRNNNCMRNNRIIANNVHHFAKHMHDVAGIYTLSSQPYSVIAENYVHDIVLSPYAHDPDHWFYLYTDEGSSYIEVKNNWCDAEKFLQNANGPGVVWGNNGPMVHDSVKINAGLKPEYQYLWYK